MSAGTDIVLDSISGLRDELLAVGAVGVGIAGVLLVLRVGWNSIKHFVSEGSGVSYHDGGNDYGEWDDDRDAGSR